MAVSMKKLHIVIMIFMNRIEPYIKVAGVKP